MKSFKFSYRFIVTAVIIGTIGITLGLHIPKEKKEPAKAQEQCELGEAVLNTPVFCWALDAVDFVIQNQLFSVLDEEDMRDAVKHYRFYRMVMDEMNG